MGFGWLIIGYFFASVVSLYSPLSFAMLAGYPMMILALYKLSPYDRHFRTALYTSLLSIPFALYYALYAFGLPGRAATMPLFADPLWSVVEWCYFAYTFLLTILVLSAILALCRDLYLVKLQAGAMRCMILLGFTYVMDLMGRLPIAQNVRGFFALIALFMRLVVIFLNIYLFYGCYRYICPEGEEMTQSLKSKNKKEEKK